MERGFSTLRARPPRQSIIKHVVSATELKAQIHLLALLPLFVNFRIMATVLAPPEIDLIETDRLAFNIAVWNKLSKDPELAKLDFQIETDAYGQILMSPIPAPSHGRYQNKIGTLLDQHLPLGTVLTECPISTTAGVRSADVAWCSPEIWKKAESLTLFPEAPEICVEVLSPSNTKAEIEEKKRLYFEAGAKEVWLCSKSGQVTFFKDQSETVSSSKIAPDFPTQI